MGQRERQTETGVCAGERIQMREREGGKEIERDKDGRETE